MACSYYIYYRVDPARAGACEPRVRELIKLVKKVTGVEGRLMVKRGEANLWMEVYENVPDESRFEWELAEAAGEVGNAAQQVGDAAQDAAEQVTN